MAGSPLIPNDAPILRLTGPRHGRSDQGRNHGSTLSEQTDDRQTPSRSIMVEAFARIDTEPIDPSLSITTKAA